MAADQRTSISLSARITKKLLPLRFSRLYRGSIEDQRARQERAAGYPQAPKDIRCEAVDVDGILGEWIEAPNAKKGVILYLHGGAYALGSINTHREFIARLARAAGMRALAIDYRLAPEHPYPGALEDSLAAYRWLQNQGVEPSQIIIAGDSAGGGLSIATLVSLRDSGMALPAGAVCISPWVDLACCGASMHEKAKADRILTPGKSRMYAKFYAGGEDLTSPLISPLYADLRGLPPVLIQVGTDEILLDDAARFADKARSAGVDVTLEIWEQMFHVFPIVWFLPEAKQAVGNMAEFITHNMGTADIP